MSDRKGALVQWFTFFGTMVGLSCPEDLSDQSLKHFYHQLCLAFYTDKHGSSKDNQWQAVHSEVSRMVASCKVNTDHSFLVDIPLLVAGVLFFYSNTTFATQIGHHSFYHWPLRDQS